MKALSESLNAELADHYLIYNKHITTRLAYHNILSHTKGISLLENTIVSIVNNDLDEHKVNVNPYCSLIQRVDKEWTKELSCPTLEKIQPVCPGI